MIKKILEYALWPSSWKGIVALAIAAGVQISPELQAQIITAGLAIIGLIQVFVDDHDKTKTIG